MAKPELFQIGRIAEQANRSVELLDYLWLSLSLSLNNLMQVLAELNREDMLAFLGPSLDKIGT
jgi:hypothetical protein